MTEKTTLLDQAKILYKEKLTEGSTFQPFIAGGLLSNPPLTNEMLPQGWALKTSKKKSRFNDDQKLHLNDKFRLGQETGIKANPAQVSIDMRRARNESGERRFIVDEFLTQQQM